MDKEGGIVGMVFLSVAMLLFIVLFIWIIQNINNPNIICPNIPCEQARNALVLGLGLPQYNVTRIYSFFGYKINATEELSNLYLKKCYPERCLR